MTSATVIPELSFTWRYGDSDNQAPKTSAPRENERNRISLELTPEELLALQEIVRCEGTRLDTWATAAAIDNAVLPPGVVRKRRVAVDISRKLAGAANDWRISGERALNDMLFWIDRATDADVRRSAAEKARDEVRAKLDALVGAQLRRRRKGVKK